MLLSLRNGMASGCHVSGVGVPPPRDELSTTREQQDVQSLSFLTEIRARTLAAGA